MAPELAPKHATSSAARRLVELSVKIGVDLQITAEQLSRSCIVDKLVCICDPRHVGIICLTRKKTAACLRS